MDQFFSRFTPNRLLAVIYTANILLSLHYYLVIYINSSFLAQYFSDTQISAFYMISSLVNLILLLNISKIINKIGNYKIASYALICEIIAIAGMIVSTNQFLLGLYFIVHSIAVPIMLFNFDVFLEGVSKDEHRTGEIRGTYLTLANVTLVISPLIVGYILADNMFTRVYSASMLFLLPLLYLLWRYFRHSVDIPVAHIKVREAITEYMKDRNLSDIFVSHLTLQLFYAYMIIYMPLYLSKYIGFEWSEIGMMFTIMLLPFVLFELPVGELADRKYGEKEILTIGFVIMGLSTLLISFLTVKNIILWTLLLFLTRTGAAFVEITSDSYFFKHVDESKTDTISVYRSTRPLAFVLAPIMATVSLEFIPYGYLFLIIGIIAVLGTHWSMRIVDTK